MIKAAVLTIGTEITTGEILNSNAAWIARQLDNKGVRVATHLSVQDSRAEILEALRILAKSELLIVSGGLGPTSDDITRACLAEYTEQPLDFDQAVWADLQALHQSRGLAIKEAHRHQCWFPRASHRLKNSVGSAFGFYQQFKGQQIFVLPGPPRELEGMWKEGVEPLLQIPKPSRVWVRWTCLGAPESEVAEVVEQVIAGRGLEVGYRAQVPYVRVKLFADPAADARVLEALDQALRPWIVARGEQDLAADLVSSWPSPELNLVDQVTGELLFQRLLPFFRSHSDRLKFKNFGSLEGDGVLIRGAGEEFSIELMTRGQSQVIQKKLPYKTVVSSERGRKSVVEWVLWESLKLLKS